MNITEIIFFGLLAGSISNILDPRKDGGLMGPLMLGVLGAVLGATLGSMFFNVNLVSGIEANIFSILISALGSLTLLGVSSIFKQNTSDKAMSSQAQAATA